MLPETAIHEGFPPEAMEEIIGTGHELRSDSVLTSEMIYSANALRIYSTK